MLISGVEEEMQTAEKSGKVAAEQLGKQRSAQMIQNRGVVGRGVLSNHELEMEITNCLQSQVTEQSSLMMAGESNT